MWILIVMFQSVHKDIPGNLCTKYHTILFRPLQTILISILRRENFTLKRGTSKYELTNENKFKEYKRPNYMKETTREKDEREIR